MKIIKRSSISSVVASSENANYPAENLLDEHPKLRWKALDSTVTSASLNFTTDGVTGGFALFGVSADRASVIVSDPNRVEWASGIEWQAEHDIEVQTVFQDSDIIDDSEIVYDVYTTTTVGVVWKDTPNDVVLSVDWTEDNAALWVEFEEFATPVVIGVSLFKDATIGDALAAGVAVAGPLLELPNPDWGRERGLDDDNSTLKRFSNGAENYTKRDTRLTYSGQFIVERGDTLEDFFIGIGREMGRQPMAWQVVQSSSATDEILYARFDDMPRESYIMPGFGQVTFSIIEVL